MLLKSIAIENFQQYEKPFELTGLSSGINVIYGDNEAGKSTLLRALRAVLFDRFNGKGADDFAGYKGGSPEQGKRILNYLPNDGFSEIVL